MLIPLDMKILCALRSDARDISPAEVQPNLAEDRIRHLVLSGIVQRFTSCCDFTKAGMNLHVAFAIASEDKDGLLRWLISQVNVNNLHRSSGSHDLFLDAYFPDMNALWEFTEGMQKFGLSRLQEFHMIEQVAVEKAAVN
jgi:DNA-binding Lrp family transcriptional regulator